MTGLLYILLSKEKKSDEEKGDTDNTDDGTEDFQESDSLMEEVARGKEDENWGHDHNGLGYACTGVKGGHEGKGDSDEGA